MHHPLYRALRKGFGLSVTIAIVVSLFVACDSGQHKCAQTSDCKTGEACQTNATTKRRECVAGTVTCAPACAADEDCKAGKCEKKPGGCTPACNADQVCDKGTCKAKDTGCKSDAECTGTNEICEVATGKCVPKSTDECKPACAADEACKAGKCEKTDIVCKGDNECSGTTPKCNVGTGACVECITMSDCAGDKTCTNNKCDNHRETCRDEICKGSERCNATTGLCEVPTGTKTAGQNCATELCIAGLQCLGTSSTDQNARFCFEPCTADADCKDAFRNKCLTAGSASDGTPIQLCLKASQKGEVCGFESAKGEQGLCAAGNTPPLYCDNTKKTCEEVILQKNQGDPCNKRADTTQPPKICDSDSGLVCKEATGTCQNHGSLAKEGEECDSDGRNNAGEVILCDKGMLCIGFDQDRSLQRCHMPCKSVSAGGDSSECKVAGTKCEDLLSGANPGLCFDTQCTTDAECAFPNNRCADAQGGGKICLPKVVDTGWAPFGGLCKDPIKLFGCNTSIDPDIFCLRAQQTSTQGFCSRNCSKDDKCPSWTDGTNTIAATCVAAGANGTKFCLFDCGQPGQICPTGLTCQAISGGMTCLAP